ncbi:hypothetical protein DSL92_04435 [Billgrantia gudaonensis]|uniref:Uncharacterized protein n=1 Tax=Billgrantia gudaonensis TaxID=376427 RepID=A0A432JJG1_9GAMM|nr:hypothetical protein DSL92_04435 [Halomonas gudaonensis]
MGKTVIMVAHRLATIWDADQILRPDQGHLIESDATKLWWNVAALPSTPFGTATKRPSTVFGQAGQQNHQDAGGVDEHPILHLQPTPTDALVTTYHQLLESVGPEAPAKPAGIIGFCWPPP